jgi:crotonobetainyl-CoA:carnitine CoA-transferase CaiB-like acyl-CoA transferase
VQQEYDDLFVGTGRAEVSLYAAYYLAETGLLDLVRGSDGTPALPFTPIADIAGGSYPAVMNILLALIRRGVTGRGARIEIAMTDMLFALPYWALPQGLRTGQWSEPGRALTTGGSPRYHIYRCADGRFLAAAPLEQKFWENFCRLIGLAPLHADDARDPAATISAVAAIVASRDAAHWQSCFAGQDVCCAIVATLAEAVSDAHFGARGLFARKVTSGGQSLPTPAAQAMTFSSLACPAANSPASTP